MGRHKQSSAHQVGMSSQNTVRAGDVIRTAEELDALPANSYFRCGCGYHGMKTGESTYVVGHRVLTAEEVAGDHLPIEVLHVPGEEPTVTPEVEAEHDALAAKVAAVEALADETGRAGDPLLRLDRLRAALSAAPTDTTKEWAHRLESGGATIWPTREQAEADRDDYLTRPRDPFEPRPPASAGIWRREVTDWQQVDQ